MSSEDDIANCKVSIAITTYNGEKYLAEQLDSLYSQTRQPDEVIAVDDCSKDNTMKILDEYGKKYNLKFYANDKNLGIAKNFEKAISLCTRDYIMLCDQDDIWLPQKIEKSLKKIKEIENNEPALVVCENIPVNSNLERTSYLPAKKDSSNFMDTFFGGGRQGCCMIMNRKLLPLVIPIRHEIYDLYIALIAAMCGAKHNLAEPLVYYRTHSGNAVGKITKSKIPFMFFLKGLMLKIYNFSVQPAIFEVWQSIREQNLPFKSDRLKIADNYSHSKCSSIFKLPCYSFLQKMTLLANTIIFRIAMAVKGKK